MNEFKSSRFVFKRIDASHASERYLSWLADAEVNQYLEIRHTTIDMSNLKDYLKSVHKSKDDYLYGIFYENEHIGNIKIGPINHYYKHADIGLMIGEEKWRNKGVGSESIYAITKLGFEYLNLNKIEAGCYETNEYSLRAFIKLGYEKEGFLRDHVILNGNLEGVHKIGITKPDWHKIEVSGLNKKFEVKLSL